MSTLPNGGPAFPCETFNTYHPRFGAIGGGGPTPHNGMSLRDYFAAKALQGYLAAHAGPDVALPNPSHSASVAYEHADAMLKARHMSDHTSPSIPNDSTTTNQERNMQRAEKETSAIPVAAPVKIGTEWPGQGGIYAGIARGYDGAPDCHLIVGPEIKASTWKKATEAAGALDIDGHKDFTLPTRKEQALQFGNVPELFERDWYWSGEKHASGSGYAWLQGFDGGCHDCSRVGSELRARAVRRLPIQ